MKYWRYPHCDYEVTRTFYFFIYRPTLSESSSRIIGRDLSRPSIKRLIEVRSMWRESVSRVLEACQESFRMAAKSFSNYGAVEVMRARLRWRFWGGSTRAVQVPTYNTLRKRGACK